MTIPTWLTWTIYGAGGFALAGLGAIALCRAAAAGDEALDYYADQSLACDDEVATRRERRRSHARNGLGTGDAGGDAA